MSNMIKKKHKLILLVILLGGTILTVHESNIDAFSNQVIQIGAVGEDVIELQSRLQYIGFFKGKIDGVFGWGTYWALRNFQSEFGLPIDGLAGSQTKQKLVSVTKYNRDANQAQKAITLNVPAGYSQNDIQLMANAVHGEAR